tara:strand:+ start:270 stop:647 length:378 start_codon:yes stop_codon:yes gene_type:complete
MIKIGSKVYKKLLKDNLIVEAAELLGVVETELSDMSSGSSEQSILSDSESEPETTKKGKRVSRKAEPDSDFDPSSSEASEASSSSSEPEPEPEPVKKAKRKVTKKVVKVKSQKELFGKDSEDILF